jgi:hypothetical protein
MITRKMLAVAKKKLKEVRDKGRAEFKEVQKQYNEGMKKNPKMNPKPKVKKKPTTKKKK